MKLWIWWSWLTCSPCSNQFLDSHLISSAIDTTHATTIIIATTLLSLPLFLLLSQNTFVKIAAVSKKAVLNIYASGHYASTFTYSTTITATIVVMEAVGLALIRLVFLPMATELAWLIAFMLQVMIKPKELSNEMKDFTCFEQCEKQNAN